MKANNPLSVHLPRIYRISVEVCIYGSHYSLALRARFLAGPQLANRRLGRTGQRWTLNPRLDVLCSPCSSRNANFPSDFINASAGTDQRKANVRAASYFFALTRRRDISRENGRLPFACAADAAAQTGWRQPCRAAVPPLLGELQSSLHSAKLEHAPAAITQTANGVVVLFPNRDAADEAHGARAWPPTTTTATAYSESATSGRSVATSFQRDVLDRLDGRQWLSRPECLEFAI